ncbi:AAA family ATPase [Ottowia testudinis]|uniref:AAA family ATPase n=1 Tax=Ottowia testudinis TaxID=2816950 RepID=A0A975CLK2_9BURK|nr:AAA family ATPase [Ottowia testudinis]QTD45718.1 AAA family ATPase [Ottowia testudinis]
MHWKDLQSLIPQPGATYDWKRLCELLPALVALESTPQDARHHAEGNVGIHTRMVLDALLADPAWQAAAEARRQVMFLAALLHDVAKPDTTVIDPVTGAIGQPGHSKRGAVDARILLWKAAMPFEEREAVCRIIAVHQLPFWAFDSRRGQTPEFMVRRLSWELDVSELTCVARADMRGRVCADQASHLADIELFEELAREQACWNQPWPAADAHTRLHYARGKAIDPGFALHQEDGSQVIVMCGMPAAGKDTWVRNHASELPVASFDDAKAELGLKHGQNDGKAAHHAIDKAKALLRSKSAFVWNATHLSHDMRNRTLDLLYAYNACVRLVYLEAPESLVFSRNARRDTTLTNKSLARMLYRWEVPLPWEAHAVEYHVV